MPSVFDPERVEGYIARGEMDAGDVPDEMEK
jgi:hypothetical protein